MEQYLIDTNVVSDYFSASFPATGMQFMDAAIDAIPNLSVMCHISTPTDQQKPTQKFHFNETSTIFAK